MNTLMRTQMPSLRSMMEEFWNPESWFTRSPFNGENLPAVNIKEDEKMFNIEVAAPGFEKQDFKVDADKGVLTISAENKKESEEKQENYTRKEFSFSSFSRSFSLPESIKEDTIKARYDNGVLHITLEKNPEPQTPKKMISVE